MKKEKVLKNVSIRIDRQFWKALSQAKIDGKISSLTQAFTDGAAELIGYKKKKKS